MHENRVEFVDVLRGCAIVLMIMGHLDFGRRFDYYIHAFHMPVWFFIAGWFQKELCLNMYYVKRKIYKLIYPYLFWGLAQYPVWLILNYDVTNKFEPLINLFWVNTNLVMPIAGALWFLTCLFFSELFFLLIQTYAFYKYEKIFMTIFCIVLGHIFPSYVHIRLPWAIDVAFVSIGFIMIGYFMRKHYHNRIINKFFNLNFLEIVLLGIINTIGIFANGYVNLRTGDYSHIILFWINSICAIILLWNLSRVIEMKFSQLFIVKEIKFIGRNSMVYLVLNQLLVTILNKVIFKLEINNVIGLYGIRIIALLMIVTILHYTVLFLKKRFSCLIGIYYKNGSAV